MKKEYLLAPYGSLTDAGFRFVAEMILNKEGDEIVGVCSMPADKINPAEVGATAKLSIRSSGIYITDVTILTGGKTRGQIMRLPFAEAMRSMLDSGLGVRPIFTGNVNKKMRIVQDCKIIGFYIGASSQLNKTLGQ